MTYIEKALGDFTRHVLTDGIRTLFTRRYIPFTLTAIVVVFFNTSTFILAGYAPQLATEENIRLLLSVEISVGLAFLLTGVLFSRLDTPLQLLALTTILVTSTLLVYTQTIDQSIVFAITGFMFVLWIVLGSISQFSFLRDFVGHPIMGGILFLGKNDDDGRVLFRGVVGLITFVNIGLGISLIQIGMELDKGVDIFLGGIIILGGLINLVPVFGFQRRGDVFFTTLAWFYVIGSIRSLYLVVRLTSRSTSEPNASLVDLIFTLFMIVFAVHKAASKSKDYLDVPYSGEIGADKDNADVPKNFWVRIFSPSGSFLIILGAAIGYHATTIQFRLNQQHLLNSFSIQAELPWNLISHELSLMTYIIVYIISMLMFVFIPKFRKYSNPEIMRIEWLPPYEDMKELLVGIKDGSVSYKGDVARLLGTLVKNQISKKIGRRDDTGVESAVRGTLSNLLRKSKEKK